MCIRDRFAVAPFDGQIVHATVETGDRVVQGQVLAEMDGRHIRWDLSGVFAEREQSIRSREIELSSGNVSKTLLAEYEFDRLSAKEAVLRNKYEHLQIKCPADGVILSGSLDRAEGKSVETGDVLFEVGLADSVRIEIAVPADEIPHVNSGYPVKVWVQGRESDPISGRITKLHPQSETRDGRNVFVAVLNVENQNGNLRPGMQAKVRIDCEKRSLAWTVFHKPVDYLRSQLTWW